ncbi:hypothetical protein BS47DRAFT_1371882 [Hydnum rufescens UP504]|uniref:Nucleoside phosphorylase domain-containing protein n=1 Tax=Hydnum rufescens UP504 TaxID=1448309 RepID=A0A9P6DVZ3_9AGAM|nr:hypothetical protein BS47DRAFT_1371882 [Hydnum rufescens UP504]
MTLPDFPRTAEGRVYHLGLKHGELAPRIVTVGDPSRALKLAEEFEGGRESVKVESDRGFLTLTGIYKGVRLSIVAIGMGFANMDFFVRECRECVDGDMFIIRFGSCGCLSDLDQPTGMSGAHYISHLPDFHIPIKAYADDRLHEILAGTLNNAVPRDSKVRVDHEAVNASTDSFYSSQGRITSFPDHNENLLEFLIDRVPGIISLEMETFHLLHLASAYRPTGDLTVQVNSETGPMPTFPLTSLPTSNPTVSNRSPSVQVDNSRGRIHACSAQMVFASRSTNAFITPEEVQQTQAWTGLACLEALTLV